MLTDYEAGLNPYFSGRWSVSLGSANNGDFWSSLNPYFSGRWSVSLAKKQFYAVPTRSLNPYFSGRWSVRKEIHVVEEKIVTS